MEKELILNFHFDPAGVLYIAIEKPRPAISAFTDEGVAVRFGDNGDIVGWTLDYAVKPITAFLPLTGDMERDDVGVNETTPGIFLEFNPRTRQATLAWARGGRPTSPVLSRFKVVNDTLTRLRQAA